MDLKELFVDHLKDIYYAERQSTKAIPKMVKAAQNAELKQFFTASKADKPHHVELLQHVFEAIGERAKGKTCEAMNGLIEEVEELLEEAREPSPVRDAGLIAGAQGIAHYGIARYGTMLAWAKAGGMDEATGPLEELLTGCKDADQKLSEMANGVLNEAAAGHEDDEDEEDEDEEDEEEDGEEVGEEGEPMKDEAPAPAPAPAKGKKKG